MGRYGVVVDGVNLPSSVIEDVRGLSLRPSYSGKQLRRIERLAKKNSGRERRYSLSLRRNNKNFPTWRFIKPSVRDLFTTGQIRRESDRYINGDLEWTEKILRDPNYVTMMREAMELWYSKPRDGWHRICHSMPKEII
jgi:hypothetical protein